MVFKAAKLWKGLFFVFKVFICCLILCLLRIIVLEKTSPFQFGCSGTLECSDRRKTTESSAASPCQVTLKHMSRLVQVKPVTTNFSLLVPSVKPNISCEERESFMIVVVNSMASQEKNSKLRMAIRTTWGNPNSSSVDHYVKRTWRLFFVLGKSANSIWQTENHRESQRFNDILIGDFDENYKNIIIKTFMGHLWAFATFSCQYVLKTDDDVYVRVPRLAHWLTKAGQPQRFYGGFLNIGFPVLRDSRSKWFISKQEYNESVYPPYCPGAFHVLSSDILPDLFNYTQYNKPFFIDDAYIGVAASDLGIKVVDIPGFRLDLVPKTTLTGSRVQHLGITSIQTL